MADENNLQAAAPYLGKASTFATSGDADPATDIELAASGWWQVTDAPAVPTRTDSYRAMRGQEIRRLFRTDTFNGVPSNEDVYGYGSVLMSGYTFVPSAIFGESILWDLGSDPGGTNLAFGGYGLQFNLVSGERRLEFLWRDEGDPAAASALLSVDIDAGNIAYPPIVAPYGSTQANGKFGNIFHVGAVLNFLPEGRYVDLFLDGNLIGSEMFADGHNVSINPAAGLTLWATSRDPADGDALDKVMNATDTGYKFSSFFAQRLDTDRSEMAARIMGDAMLLRQAKPSSAQGL